jgi:transcription elongation factor GreA
MPGRQMIKEMQEKLGKEFEALSHELTVTLPKAIATAVEMGDLKENSEYKAALERQQFVQARLGQLQVRRQQLNELVNMEAPRDRVGLGTSVTVVDIETKKKETFIVVLSEMIDVDAGHISLQSPLGQALRETSVGDEVKLRLPHIVRKLRVVSMVTVHDQAK